MKARRYVNTDKSILDQWHLERGLPQVPDNMIPEIGFIVENVGAGFLYLTDSKLALIEGFITSKNSHIRERDEALDLLCQELIGEAQSRGVAKILALTTAQTIYERALKYSFTDIGNYRVLYKDLTGDKVR